MADEVKRAPCSCQLGGGMKPWSEVELRIPEPYRSAHRASYLNREAVMASQSVGCFYCGNIFASAEIVDWTDNERTAICPYCHIDSVLPDSQPLTHDFLAEMHRAWF